VSQTVQLTPPICDYCGGYIRDRDQQCPARDEKRCWPRPSISSGFGAWKAISREFRPERGTDADPDRGD
jgi:hypothetical protein